MQSFSLHPQSVMPPRLPLRLLDNFLEWIKQV